MTPINHPKDESSFSGGGGLPADPRGGGTMMSHLFQEGVGGRDESPFPKRGGGP